MTPAGELVVGGGQLLTPTMRAWSPPTGAAPEPSLRRPYLPCVPAPVYRGWGSHSTVAIPRALPASQSGSGSPGERPGPPPQTPAADAAATRPGAGPGAPEVVDSNPEGGATPEAEAGPEGEAEAGPEGEAEAGPEGEAEARAEGEDEAGPEASLQSPLRWTSGRPWPGPKLRRSRTVFSIWQVSTLERVFQKTPYPSFEDTAALAQELRITEAQVKIWFQNRRKKLKRQLQEQAQFLAPTRSNPFWTIVDPGERLQPDYHTCPFLCEQNSVLPPTCIPGFNHSLYASRDLQALGLQMPYYHPNF
ncbi:homeobox protein Nkx-3.1-like [Antechinus flavipes]|uniref:homeobox protein Nkx-3.1-like n=1 Tax=Antechinus flavipes TaxID=38775 RepID=UPI002236B182|nr:homeobox protein Nkx-3.1-like [Antechinus flavipes]